MNSGNQTEKFFHFLEHSQFSWYAKINALARFRVSLNKLFYTSDKSISLSFILISYVNIYIILHETWSLFVGIFSPLML